VVAKIRKKLAVSKQAAQTLDGEIFNLKKLNDLEVGKQYQNEITNRFAAFGNLSDDEDRNRDWNRIKKKEIGVACGVYGGGVYRVLVGKPERKRPPKRSRCRREGNIKMYFQEVGCGLVRDGSG
jgi:hypothetical protein